MKISWLDMTVVLAAVVFCIATYMLFWQGSNLATGVEIRGNDLVKNYSLFEDRVVSIQGPLGVSQIEIKNGQARFLSSPCPNQFCVLAGWLTRSGQVSVCLPNALSLRVLGDEQLDAINF